MKKKKVEEEEVAKKERKKNMKSGRSKRTVNIAPWWLIAQVLIFWSVLIPASLALTRLCWFHSHRTWSCRVFT